MSPILVRPVREQFEHDRVIRVLQAKYKRKYDVAINPGAEQNASVGIGDLTMFPDLVLFSHEKTRKIHGTVEVETAESINTLEAQAEWGPFSRLRTPFFLYVPANSLDTARRLCTEHSINPAEIWTYHMAIDQVRFTMVHRSPDAPKGTLPEHKPKPVPPPVDLTPVEAPPSARLRAILEAPSRPARGARAAKAKAVKTVPPVTPPPPVAPPTPPPEAKPTAKAEPTGKVAAAKAGPVAAAKSTAPQAKSAPPAKTTKTGTPATNTKTGKSGKAGLARKAGKTGNSGKPAPASKSTKSAKSAKLAKSVKVAKPSKAGKTSTPAKAQKSAKTAGTKKRR